MQLEHPVPSLGCITAQYQLLTLGHLGHCCGVCIPTLCTPLLRLPPSLSPTPTPLFSFFCHAHTHPGMETPAVPGMLPGMATPEMYNAARAERELWERNKPMTDEELDALLPGTESVRGHDGVTGCGKGAVGQCGAKGRGLACAGWATSWGVTNCHACACSFLLGAVTGSACLSFVLHLALHAASGIANLASAALMSTIRWYCELTNLAACCLCCCCCPHTHRATRSCQLPQATSPSTPPPAS